MRHGQRNYKAVLLLLVCVLSASAQRPKGNGWRFNFGPSLGFYTINENHASNPSARASLTAGFRREWRTDRSYRTFFLLGLDYFVHGLNYRSYYFPEGSLKLYDKNFNHDYALTIQEVQVPAQLKLLFSRGDNKLHSPYAIIGYHLRFLASTKVMVTENGNFVRKDYPDLVFRNYIGYNKMNALVSAGLGWQRNSFSNGPAAFFVEMDFRYGFSQYYFTRDYTAESVFINGSHLVLLLGLRF